MSDGNTVSGTISRLLENKISNWKETLSGAFDDRQLFFALILLQLFYIVYTIVNAVHHDNTKDEDSITELCKCNPDHRGFYKNCLIIFFVFWALFHSLILLFDLCDHFNRLAKIRKNCGNMQKECKCPGCISNEPENGCCYTIRTIVNNVYRYFSQNDEITRCEFHLWTQYCELYVVGITKISKTYDHVIEEKLQPSESNAHENKKNKDYVTAFALPKDCKFKCDCDTLRYLVQGSFFILIKFMQFIAQLAVVPLLMIQMFDTYAFLCLTADNYCSMRSEYKLHLDQTGITFGFYLALVTSLLSTTMLRWFPWPSINASNNTADKNQQPTSQDHASQAENDLHS